MNTRKTRKLNTRKVSPDFEEEQGKSLAWAYVKFQLALAGMRFVTGLIGLVIGGIIVFILLAVGANMLGIDLGDAVVSAWQSLTGSVETISELSKSV